MPQPHHTPEGWSQDPREPFAGKALANVETDASGLGRAGEPQEAPSLGAAQVRVQGLLGLPFLEN